MLYRWQGVNAHEVATGGRLECDPSELADWVLRTYRKGWRALSVHAETGDVAAELTLVAAIQKHPGTGRRTWWAEGPVSDEAV
jgi:predicted amidohydrolase YtcJ